MPYSLDSLPGRSSASHGAVDFSLIDPSSLLIGGPASIRGRLCRLPTPLKALRTGRVAGDGRPRPTPAPLTIVATLHSRRIAQARSPGTVGGTIRESISPGSASGRCPHLGAGVRRGRAHRGHQTDTRCIATLAPKSHRTVGSLRPRCITWIRGTLLGANRLNTFPPIPAARLASSATPTERADQGWRLRARHGWELAAFTRVQLS